MINLQSYFVFQILGVFFSPNVVSVCGIVWLHRRCKCFSNIINLYISLVFDARGENVIVYVYFQNVEAK
jgi:hypothetical protein